MRKIIVLLLAALSLGLLAGCGGSQADTVSKNLSKEAEKFNVVRRIVVTNNITDKVEFEVTGRCSWENPGHRLDVTCKEGPGKYTKSSIIMGDNNTAAVVQLATANVSEYRTKIIIRPTSIVPDLDLVTGEKP